jgi:fluoroquinolone resistance protein
MTSEDPAPRAISREEVQATAESSRTFSGVLFPSTLALEGIDFTESRFERCLFRVPTIRSVDFSGAAFNNCTFEPTRFASCKLANARFYGCTLFDLRQKKGCTFAFCDIQAAEAVQCNFATSSFERCDLYNVRAVECSFRGARFRHSTFSKALSRRSALTKAAFDKCNLSFADLSGLQLQSCEFLSCKFSEACFIDTDLSQATMLACALDRAEWDRARLRQADLRGSQISGLNLSLLSDYAGLTISESEQSEILRQLGLDVRP